MLAKSFMLSLSVLAATVACGVSGPEGEGDLSYAATIFSCGPADGPVTNIVLANRPIRVAEPSYPHVLVVFEESVGGLAGRSWDVASATAPGVWYVTGPGQAQAAASGRVTMTSVDSANTVAGSMDFQFPARLVATEFSAPWLETNITCP